MPKSVEQLEVFESIGETKEKNAEFLEMIMFCRPFFWHIGEDSTGQGSSAVKRPVLCLGQARRSSGAVAADGCQIGASFAAAAPRQTAKTLVARARGCRCPVLDLVQILLFLHAKQALLFVNSLTIDATATNSPIEAKSSTRATNTTTGSHTVDAWVHWATGDASFIAR